MTATRVSAVLIFVTLASVTILGCSEKAQVAVPPPPEVIVSLPLKQKVTEFLEFPGTTAALEFVEIRARVEGWLESVDFEPGARVEEGALLFVIDPKPYQAQVDQNEAVLKAREAEFQLKDANLRRAEHLLATGSVSQLQYDVQSAEKAVAQAQVGMAKADLEKAQLNLSYTRVTSPTTGTISRNYVDVGNLVGAGEKTLLTEIVNDDSVYVYFDMSERELLMLMRRWPRIQTEKPSERDRPPAYLQLADESGFPHKGAIDFGEPRVDESTGTLKVRAVFPNEKKLLFPGLFCRVRVPLEEKEALLVPELAVGIAQVGRYVLVVDKDQVVEQRLVETGRLEGTLRVIEKGLKQNDWVVVNAIQRAIPGTKVTPKETSIGSPPQQTNEIPQSSGK
ncbi:MAG: efflux RND transporter periplasmic adaptor subunit [Desulfomonilaceae bacterium]|nr:efflux RND transporter periplasmic adaptor subunit [Desulfomonilaceae bacterium]